MLFRSHFISALVSLLVTSCTATPTELVVVVTSDLAVPAALDAVEIVAQAPGGGRTQTAGAALGAGQPPLPRTLGMVHRGGPLGSYRVTVTGRLGGAVVLERVADLTFVSGEVRTWSVHLAAACVGVDCGAETCSEGTCRPIAVAESELDAWPPSPRADGGRVDSGPADSGPVDSGPVDSGPSPEDAGPPTDGGGCLCADRCGCDFAGAVCSDDSTCTVDARSSNFDGRCDSGASCTIDASSGPSNVDVTCAGTGTTCVLDCTGVSNCTLSCRDGAACSVDCSGTSNCDLDDCSTATETCGGQLEVCNMPCP